MQRGFVFALKARPSLICKIKQPRFSYVMYTEVIASVPTWSDLSNESLTPAEQPHKFILPAKNWIIPQIASPPCVAFNPLWCHIRFPLSHFQKSEFSRFRGAHRLTTDTLENSVIYWWLTFSTTMPPSLFFFLFFLLRLWGLSPAVNVKFKGRKVKGQICYLSWLTLIIVRPLDAAFICNTCCPGHTDRGGMSKGLFWKYLLEDLQVL